MIFNFFFICSTEKAKESIFYSYNKNINGFAAILDEDEAAEIASMCTYVLIHIFIFHFAKYIYSFILIF
jgi:hypothetical protein